MEQPSTETETSCPTCGAGEVLAIYADETPLLGLHPLVACRSCGLVFQRLARTLDQLDDAQAGAYGAPGRRFAGPVELFVRLFRSARVRLAMHWLPAGGRVLDVGCGRGLFLGELRARGCSVRGTELSRSTAAQADPEVPIDVGELRADHYPDASFDLISIWHVLEHLREPDRALRICRRALAPDGHLLLAMPNFGSAQSRAGGPHWFHLDLPRHLFHFTPQTLERLLGETGFRLVTCRTGQWEMDPFGWVQTLLNRCGLRHNALYDTLRNNPDAKRDLSRGTRLALLALFPLAMALALPLAAACRLLGRAGTIIAVARPDSRAGSESAGAPATPPSPAGSA